MKQATLLLALLWPAAALSQYESITGSDLVSWCEEPVSVYCSGYLLGVADSLEDHHNLCLPEKVTVRSLRSVFLSWAKANPALLNKRASALLDLAYKGVWPCKR